MGLSYDPARRTAVATFPASFLLDVQPAEGPPLGRLERLPVHFSGALHAVRRHSKSDMEVLAEAEFDWSRLPPLALEDIVGSIDHYFVAWQRTGTCPDPQMYEVEDSLRLRELRLRSSRHFLILGHDDFFEVVAVGWRWESDAAHANPI